MKKKSRIQNKFFKYFTAFAVVPVICFSILASIYVFMNEVKIRKEDAQKRTDTIAQDMNQLITEVNQIGNTVCEDESLKHALHKDFADIKERYGTNLEENSDLLYISKYFNQNIHVYVIGNNGGVFKSGYLSLKQENFQEAQWYQDVVQSQQAIWFDIHKNSFVANTMDSNYLSLGIPIADSITKKNLGVVLVELQVDAIFKDTVKEEEENVYVIHPNTDINIEDGKVELYQDNKIVALEDDFIVYEAVQVKPDYITGTMGEIRYWNENFEDQGTFETKQYLIHYQKLELSNWIIVSVVNNEKLYQNIYTILIATFLFLIPLLLVVFYVSYQLSNSVSKPILNLKGKMEEVQTGNFEVSIARVSDDEIGELSDQFNQMVFDIKNLMRRIYEEQTKMRNYELMLLQAQINPHFLYNTLDSLQWLIRMEQLDDAMKMTKALTQFFVTGLNQGNDVISIEKEMENAGSYLTIQQLRYKSKLNFHIHYEKEIEKLRIPKLILQPFVENALYHGIKSKEQGGFIEVRGYEESGTVHLKIIDDGVGMTKEVLKRLKDEMNHPGEQDSDSYGIKNVNTRLQIFYKDRCTLEITSEVGVGTVVSIAIKENENV